MMHEKIGLHHLERKAILYVRQSSAHQVLHNRESSTLQYAMRDRLTARWRHYDLTPDEIARYQAEGWVVPRFQLPEIVEGPHVPSPLPASGALMPSALS